MTTVETPFWGHHAVLAGAYRDRVEWLALRRTGIGSSDCSAVLGMGKYGSPYSVWADKCGHARPADETEAMLWGTLLEPVIRAELGRRIGMDIDECPTLRSRERSWQLYNPDGVIPAANAIVEIKNASAWLAHEWPHGEVPDHAELQTQHGMAVTGADGAYVAGLVGGNRLRWEYVERNQRLIDVINAAEEHLWETYVLPDVAPPIDGSDATAEAIAERWPRRFDVEQLATNIDAALAEVAAYQFAHAAEKRAKADKAQAVNRLTDMLRGGDVLVDAKGGKLAAIKRGQFRERAFREQEPNADLWLKKVEIVDRDELRAAEPELYRRYQSTSIYFPKN